MFKGVGQLVIVLVDRIHLRRESDERNTLIAMKALKFASVDEFRTTFSTPAKTKWGNNVARTVSAAAIRIALLYQLLIQYSGMDTVLPLSLRSVLSVLMLAQDTVHFRQLARASGLAVNSLKRELERLRSLGVVESQRVKNRMHYKLARRSAVARGLQQLLVLEDVRKSSWKAFPVDRDGEERLVRFCSHVEPSPALWRNFGDPEFLAGLAVWLAGHATFDRKAYLALAESLHPGASTLESFQAWHEKYRPSPTRFLPFLDREVHKHAKAPT